VPETEPQGTEVFFSPDTEGSVLGVWILGTVNASLEGHVSVMRRFHLRQVLLYSHRWGLDGSAMYFA